MRIYVPVTAAAVTALVEGRPVPSTGPDGTTAFAVTPGLRSWYGEDHPPGADEPDDEDLEYAACAEAARASLRLLASDPAAPRRRIVLAVDVRDDQVSVHDDLERGVVRTAAPITADRLAALFVDDADASAAVGRAADVIVTADLGDEAAEETVGDTEGFELSWFGPGELALVDLDLGAETD
ncbi:DUF6912 family protein [Jatrophihabitans sp. YIM 134969]